MPGATGTPEPDKVGEECVVWDRGDAETTSRLGRGRPRPERDEERQTLRERTRSETTEKGSYFHVEVLGKSLRGDGWGRERPSDPSK